jgi:hypothetical protein
MTIPGVGSQVNTSAHAATPLQGRPRYALEGHEDEIYHEQRVPGRSTDPEYCAFLDQSWTFNRAMRWEKVHDTLLCYEAGGDLAITGAARVADWFSDPVNRITHEATTLRFDKASARQRDAVVLPGLQTNLAQHPRLVVEVVEATAAWQVCVLVKGRSGPPLVASDWQNGAGRIELDLAAAWQAKGYALRFAELHLAVGLWTDTPDTPAHLIMTAVLPGQAALVPCLPVIRAAGSSAPITAMVIAADGTRLGPADVAVTAEIAGRQITLLTDDACWHGTAALPVGDAVAHLRVTGAVTAEATLSMRVTDGRQHYVYDDSAHSLTRAGQVCGPVSGSYQGMVFARDVGTPAEALVQGQAAWDAWDRIMPPGEHWHYWEALTEAELEERFAYLEACGWDLLHLCQGWGVWEKLDAGGHLAPHGAEQLALLLRVASRHGLALLQALSHYPYGQAHTPVLRQYLEAGFQDADWTHPEAASRFTAMFHQYLQEYASLFRDETALVALSTSGEGDIAAGPARVNDTYRLMQREMPDTLFLAEPIHRLFDLPDAHRRQWHVHDSWAKGFAEGSRTDVAWEPQLAGSRMYWIGEELLPEIDLAIEFKFLQMGDYFMGEGSWPCPHLYSRFMGHADTWAGTERYRRRVRDSLYLGLVHRCPILLTWDEQYTEDERMVLRQVRSLIDWAQPFQDAPVALRVNSANVGGGPWGADGRKVLGQYEEYFSALPLMTRYLQPDEPAPAGIPVFDARQPYTDPALLSTLLASSPLRISPGYHASYLWSVDRRTLVAYLYNSTAHTCLEGRADLSGKWHRTPQPATCELALRHLPAGGTCRIFSLDAKCSIREQALTEATCVSLAAGTDDYLLVVTP